jgi:hypothetical protein
MSIHTSALLLLPGPRRAAHVSKGMLLITQHTLRGWFYLLVPTQQTYHTWTLQCPAHTLHSNPTPGHPSLFSPKSGLLMTRNWPTAAGAAAPGACLSCPPAPACLCCPEAPACLMAAPCLGLVGDTAPCLALGEAAAPGLGLGAAPGVRPGIKATARWIPVLRGCTLMTDAGRAASLAACSTSAIRLSVELWLAYWGGTAY